MRFLIDASLPRAVADEIISANHQAVDVRDIGLGTSPDSDIAEHARLNQLAIISADNDFGNIRDYPPADYGGIVVIKATATANRATILSIVRRFLQQADIVDQLPGRLAIVESTRFRLRPAP